MLTNRDRTFLNSCAIETGLPDFHKMTVTVLSPFLKKAEPKVMLYTHRSLIEELSGNLNITNNTALDSFLDICTEALNKTAPLKEKFIRANKT